MFCFYITIHLAVNNKVHIALIGSIRFIHRKISKHITKHDRFKRHQNRAVLVNPIKPLTVYLQFFMSLSNLRLKCYDKSRF